MKTTMHSTGNVSISKLRHGYVFWVTLLIVLISGCTVVTTPTATDLILTAQPASPLIPGNNTVLVENRWRLTQVLWQERSLEWDLIGPVFISFDRQGFLGVLAVNCNGASFIIVAEDEHHYRLVPGESTAAGCVNALGDQQEHDLHAAVLATTEYEVRGNQLILSGQDVRIVAEMEPPS